MKRQVLILAAFAMALCLAPFAWTDDQGQEKGKGKGKGKGKSPEIVEVDLSKLPPALAKELRAQLQAKSKVRSISLTEAIKIVEATGKGEVERAERRTSKGATQFHVEVNTGERHRTRITLDAGGKILGSKVVD